MPEMTGSHSKTCLSLNHLPTWGLALALIGLAAFMPLSFGVAPLVKGEIKAPEVALQEVGFGLPVQGELPLSFTVRLTNPNNQELRLLGYDFVLFLEDRQAARGDSPAAVILPPLGEAQARIPVLVKQQAILEILPALVLPRAKIRYRLQGGLRLASLVGGLRVPFRFTGEATPQEAWSLLQNQLR